MRRLVAALEADPRPDPPPGTRLAAVLVPIVEPSTSVLFTERALDLPRHPGEISFPGGLPSGSDERLHATALRETQEELGIAPSLVEVLGALPPVHTFVSGILIVPFVGILSARPRLSPNEGEIAGVLEFGLSDLARAQRQVEIRRDGATYRGHAYEIGRHTIWGATARVLGSLLDVLDAAEPAARMVEQ